MGGFDAARLRRTYSFYRPEPRPNVRLEGLDGDVEGAFNENTVNYLQGIALDTTGASVGDVLTYISGVIIMTQPPAASGSVLYWATTTVARSVDPAEMERGNIGILRPVRGTWQWDPDANVDDDDGAAVIRPTYASASNGRFIRVTESQREFMLAGEYGQLPVSSSVGAPIVLARSAVLERISLARRWAGSGGVTRIDVTVDGSSVFAADADKPVVTAGDGDSVAVRVVPTVSSSSPGLCIVPSGSFVECTLEWMETPLLDPPPSHGGPEGLTVTLGFV